MGYIHTEVLMVQTLPLLLTSIQVPLPDKTLRDWNQLIHVYKACTIHLVTGTKKILVFQVLKLAHLGLLFTIHNIPIYKCLMLPKYLYKKCEILKEFLCFIYRVLAMASIKSRLAYWHFINFVGLSFLSPYLPKQINILKTSCWKKILRWLPKSDS